MDYQTTESLSVEYQEALGGSAPVALGGSAPVALGGSAPVALGVGAAPLLALPPAPSLPTAPLATRTAAKVWPALKRMLDIVASISVLIAALPLLTIVALAIKLDSPGPIFYRVRRVGYRGRALMMLKFRKMHHDAAGGPLTTGGDPRLTRLGAVLTRTRLDELPQLWDVLRGRMSIIGPRPEDPDFVALHEQDYAEILAVRPGISGLSQLAYAAESNILSSEDPVEDYIGRILPQKLRMDKLYAARSSLRLDAAIVFWTVITVLLRRPVAVHRETARMNIRRRPTAKAPALELAPAPAAEPVGQLSAASASPSPAQQSIA